MFESEKINEKNKQRAQFCAFFVESTKHIKEKMNLLFIKIVMMHQTWSHRFGAKVLIDDSVNFAPQ